MTVLASISRVCFWYLCKFDLNTKEHVPSQFLNSRDLTLNMNEFVVSQSHVNKNTPQGRRKV